jgi:hypothetical protein
MVSFRLRITRCARLATLSSISLPVKHHSGAPMLSSGLKGYYLQIRKCKRQFCLINKKKCTAAHMHGEIFANVFCWINKITLSYLILSYLILSYLISSHLILYLLISSYLIVSYLILYYLNLIVSYLILYCC